MNRLGTAWLGLASALAIHTVDEASTGFLGVYNPTVIALRQKLGFWPMPMLDLHGFLSIMITLLVILFAMSPFAYGGSRWLRPVFYVVAVLMLMNGISHIVATILGHTVDSVRFQRPAPGFYSSPLLLLSSAYALVQRRRTST